MTGEQFLDLASKLAVWPGAREEHFRSAVSRAYYGAFHVAKELVEGLGFTVPDGPQGHGNLWRRLGNCGSSDAEQAGSLLSSLRTERNDADYQLRHPKFSRQQNAMLQVETAQRIATLL